MSVGSLAEDSLKIWLDIPIGVLSRIPEKAAIADNLVSSAIQQIISLVVATQK